MKLDIAARVLDGGASARRTVAPTATFVYRDFGKNNVPDVVATGGGLSKANKHTSLRSLLDGAQPFSPANPGIQVTHDVFRAQHCSPRLAERKKYGYTK